MSAATNSADFNYLPRPFPPAWASAWGDDQFGLWAEFTYQDHIVQRMRWIEPGQFVMGAPEDEAESYEGEWPQHRVVLSNGFWLADTTCTQALWQAVMGSNPSRFVAEKQGGMMHPVEQVSYLMVQDFLQRLQISLPACSLTLPTEAEWEYACRAGSTTAFYFGTSISTAQINYDGNYPYAGGQKGEYRGATVAVKALPANAWGLYQMHGNVWEWCADTMRTYKVTAAYDPGLEQALATAFDTEAARVLRGGGWGNDARGARSAFRIHDQPGGLSFNIGFRFVLRATSQASGV
jgi:formylglycine-generating enzyme required for sulfatase activity